MKPAVFFLSFLNKKVALIFFREKRSRTRFYFVVGLDKLKVEPPSLKFIERLGGIIKSQINE
jgi:hypothetical protein